ncbi:D-amino-acid transaminase [Filibacter tadaridae]|uniref:D-alanine aminotransferase n=1 Tax=Filibacter tadaridae TaxID=2483811 RepID=A0A3P5WU03_9BACL|nr:D-amino-acid transaminase [Filibacter tadaridae]VDC26862.1 D-alanine aminotransferase [Filibacter tadaridae]
MTIYFVDGLFMEKEEVTISIDDRGYYFGDGVYEVMKVYDGELFTSVEHLSRLFQSAAKIKMTIPYTETQLVDIAKELVKVNSIKTGHVYIQVTRGAAPRQHHFCEPATTPIVTAYAIQNPRPESKLQQGVGIKSVEDVRWLRCDIKSLNLLGNVLAKEEAHENGCFEALLHRGETVTEGSSSNMFGVKDGTVYSHPADTLILNGITRQVVLDLCKDNGIPVKEIAFTLEEAFEMDEFFLTSTTSEVMPVTTIDNRPVGTGVPGPITLTLQQAFISKIPLSVAGDK